MRTAFGIAFLAALIASVLTAATLELLGEREPARRVSAEARGGPMSELASAPARRDSPALAAPASDLAPRLDEFMLRLGELESRLRRLEARENTDDRAPVDAAESAERAAAAERRQVKGLLLDLLAEVEAERSAEELQTNQEQLEDTMRFELRRNINEIVSSDFALTRADTDWLVELMVEHGRRHFELVQGIDPQTTDREQLDLELEELQRWLRDQIRNEFGQELADRLLGPE